MITTLQRVRFRSISLTPIVAWSITLFVSLLPNIILRELWDLYLPWLTYAKIGVLAVLVLLSLVLESVRPLRQYLVTLLVLYLVNRIFKDLMKSPAWQARFHLNAPFIRDMLGTQLLRFGGAMILVATTWLMKGRREDFFLVKGRLRAPAEPVRWLAIRRGARWDRLCGTFSIVACLGTSSFLLTVGPPTLTDLSSLLPVLPAILLYATMNAFSEEMSFRAAFLATLPKSMGKSQSLLLTATYFGLAHYWGVPYGPVGVVLAGLLGWLLGKIMLETRGFFWAWFIHFLQDVFIFAFLAMGIVTAGGR